jgi:hypothetical protein
VVHDSVSRYPMTAYSCDSVTRCNLYATLRRVRSMRSAFQGGLTRQRVERIHATKVSHAVHATKCRRGHDSVSRWFMTACRENPCDKGYAVFMRQLSRRGGSTRQRRRGGPHDQARRVSISMTACRVVHAIEA